MNLLFKRLLTIDLLIDQSFVIDGSWRMAQGSWIMAHGSKLMAQERRERPGPEPGPWAPFVAVSHDP